MENSLFSFGILTYRNFDGIIETLKSLFSQDYPRIELVFSDDGSANYETEIEPIRRFIEENKPSNIVNVIYSHFDVNQGTVRNLNNAIRISNGEYYKSLGGGDLLACTDALSRYVSFLENSDYNIVFSKMVGFTEDGTEIKHLASCEENYDLLRNMNTEQLRNRLYERNCLPGPAWCIRKKLVEKNGYFPEDIRIVEDYPYWIKLCLNNEKIGFMDDVLVRYMMNMSGAGNYSILFMEDMFKIYRTYIFPYDKRYGIMQPVYNGLKIMGLNAYMAKSKMSGYSGKDKIIAHLKYGVFFAYISFGQRKIERKNNKENK